MQPPKHDAAAQKPRTPGFQAVLRSGWWASASVGVLALLLRFLHLWSLSSTEVFRLPLGDGVGYDQWARRIVAGDWLGSQVFYQAPLYPYFLAVVYKLLGADVVCARVVQAFIGTGSCMLLADAGRIFFGRRVGWIAGLLLAVYPTAIFFDGLIQKSVLDLFFVCLVLCLFGRVGLRPQNAPGNRSLIGLPLLLGAAMGALVLTRENAILLVPVGFAWAGACAKARGVRAALTAMLLVAVGLAVALLPVAIRNNSVGGEFHLTTSQMGPNLYIGNHAGASGTYEPLRPGRGRFEYERADATDIAEQAAGQPLTPAQVSDYWVKRVTQFVLTSPSNWLGLMKTKAMLLVNQIELVDTEDQYSFAKWSPVMRWSAGWLGFGILIPLACAGAVVSWRSLHRTWVLHAMVLVYAASVIAFYVVSRYRFPLVPMLILLAVAGVIRILRRWRRSRAFSHLRSNESVLRKRNLKTSLAGIIAGLALTVCLWPCQFTVPQMMASTYSNIGEELARHPETQRRAPAFFAHAIELFPNNPHAYINLAACFIRTSQWGEAVAAAGVATRQAPRSPDSWFTLAIAMAGAGRGDDAVAAYSRAASIDPARPDIQTNLGNLLVERGAFDAALPRLKEAIRLSPNNADFHFNLGSLYARSGNMPKAIESLERAVQINSNNSNAWFNLALAYRNGGRTREAVAALERYLVINPNDADGRGLLDEMRAEAGVAGAASGRSQKE